MSKQQPLPGQHSGLRKYTSRFQGPALLVCRKCQRKLRHSGERPAASKLKKALKKLAKADPKQRPVHIIPVGCLKLCPKGAVTVCTGFDLQQTPVSLTLIRTRNDIAALYRQCVDSTS